MSKYSVIVPASGRSERFGGDDKNKVFAKLDGRPVFLRTLERFRPRDYESRESPDWLYSGRY